MLRARYRRIVFFFARILLGIAYWDILLPYIGLRSWSKSTRPARLRRSAVAFRSLAIQMGGVLIKVGQFLSSRVDVLPVEVTSELTGLQDEVPPVSFEAIRKVAEAEFDGPLSQKFLSFDPTPLAAASLGQVHRAQIIGQPANENPQSPDQTPLPRVEVVVKIQRPNIETIITTDLAALRTVGKWVNKYRPISRRANVPALLEEFTRTLYEEVDYLAEGQNAETFNTNFMDQPGVKVPKVIWTHTTKRVLTLENVWAIKITDYNAITDAGIDRKEVASRLLETYLQQIFEDAFFHADPHPGNLFVEPLQVLNTKRSSTSRPYVPWQLTFVDFGMVGHIPENIHLGLRELLIGIGTQDSARVVKSYQLLGVLLPNADLELLEKAQAKVFDRFWGMNMTELTNISARDIHEFTSEFRELIYSLPFQVPQDLIFLARCVSILSGMCTGLDPAFNVWDHLAPYAQKMIAEDGKSVAETWLNEFLMLARSFVAMPGKIDTILTKIDRGEIIVRSPEVSQQVSQLANALRQVTGAVVFTGLIIGGVQLYLAGQLIIGAALLAGAGASLGWIFLIGRRKK